MISPELTNYEQADQYVFHGTDVGNINEFEPRQALSFQKPDGEPSVFAAASIEPAIFMAIIGSRRAAGWDSSRFTPPFGFFISQSNWEKAQKEEWAGYVYVLDRASFTKGNGWVWRTEKSVKPINKFLVTFSDVSKEIPILSDQDEAAYVKQNSLPYLLVQKFEVRPLRGAKPK